MANALYIVTGAPGAGKTTAVQSFLRLNTDPRYVAFDIDWLAESASCLAGKSIYTEPSTWQPYSKLWFAVLHAVCLNGKIPIFFTPNDPSDMEKYRIPEWCRSIEWLLLDCDDDTRRRRLAERPGWTATAIDDAIADARCLRGQGIRRQIDTGVLAPDQVALRILEWVQQCEV